MSSVWSRVCIYMWGGAARVGLSLHPPPPPLQLRVTAPRLYAQFLVSLQKDQI